jgi:hypothetical protein
VREVELKQRERIVIGQDVENASFCKGLVGDREDRGCNGCDERGHQRRRKQGDTRAQGAHDKRNALKSA